MPDLPNLFGRLHKWATRQDENFLTESLAVVLESLLSLSPEVGTRLISQLTGEFIHVPPDDAGTIEINTQVEAEKGRPDLEISIPYRLAWIEVKVESELRTGQLEGYRVMLADSDKELTRLILLTRYPTIYAAGVERPDLEVRWYEVADWLENVLTALDSVGDIAAFLARQFLVFLRVRGMTLTQVGKYMPEGLRALANLLNMLVGAAGGCKVSVVKRAGWDYIGIRLDGQKYWAGINFADPGKLWFVTRCRINPEAANQLGVGELTEEGGVPGQYRWRRGVELDSEEVHFFSRSKVSQMEWLEDFLRDCLEKARAIEIPNQPPMPEEPEGN